MESELMNAMRATDETHGFQSRTTGQRAFFRTAASRVMVIVLASALAVGAASTATAAPLVINTDGSWLATNLEPGAEWNTNPSFDTSGWLNATVVIPACHGAGLGDCIWYDEQFSATQTAWLRQTFTISSPVVSAFLVGGVDDDADIYLNGFLVFSNHDGFAANYGPLDVAQYLLQGVNLIAVRAWDNIPVYGQNHAFLASLNVQKPETVPEPASSLVLLGSAVAGLALFRRKRQR